MVAGVINVHGEIQPVIDLRRLLGGQGPKAALVNPNEDALMKAARMGQPLPVPTIDMHMHFSDDVTDGVGGGDRKWHGDPQRIFHVNRRLGVIGGAVMSWKGPVKQDVIGGNACPFTGSTPAT